MSGSITPSRACVCLTNAIFWLGGLFLMRMHHLLFSKVENANKAQQLFSGGEGGEDMLERSGENEEENRMREKSLMRLVVVKLYIIRHLPFILRHFCHFLKNTLTSCILILSTFHSGTFKLMYHLMV